MKAYSGVLVTRGFEPNDGFVRIPFDDWPGDGELVESDPDTPGSRVVGQFGQPIQVGGDGNFTRRPAYTVHLREITIEDSRRGSGRREIDNWDLNSSVTANTLTIRWRTPERRSEVEEIGMLVIGE